MDVDGRIRRRRTRVAAAGVAAAALLGAGPAQAAPVACGQVLASSTTVGNDLAGCPGDGLVVGADSIVIDLDGHTISGSHAGTGIDFGGHDDVVVRDGVIESFELGVLADGDRGVVRDLRVRHNDRGVRVDGGVANRVADSVIELNFESGLTIRDARRTLVDGVRSWANEFSGILLVDGRDNRVESSEGFANNGIGISVFEETGSVVTRSRAGGPDFSLVVGDADGVTVSRTVAEGGFEAGFFVLDSVGDGVRLTGNRVVSAGLGIGFFVRDNHGAPDRLTGNHAREQQVGFLVSSGTGTVLRGNVAGSPRGRSGATGGNGTGIDVLGSSSGVVLEDNRAHHNGTGILVRADPVGTLLDGNAANFNERHGIADFSGDATFTRNVAAYNGAVGLLAQPSSTDGGANHAHHNAGGDCTTPPLTC